MMEIQSTHVAINQMADFRPFQAWRYNPKTVDLSKVIAPPYDIISASEQERLYEKSPHNCVRLILNKIEPADTETDSRYTRARDFFNTWRRQNILIQDQTPGFYLYRQTFFDRRQNEKRRRFALLGLLRLEDFDKGIVIPHEKTLSKPCEDRRKLIEATHTNFSPVFGLYEDSGEGLHAIYSKAAGASPVFCAGGAPAFSGWPPAEADPPRSVAGELAGELVDEEGVSHALWLIQDPETIEQIREKTSRHKIYIADGHHRYQTALEYAKAKRRGEGNGPEEERPYDFVLTALVGFSDPGLLVFPTHRIVKPYPGFEALRAMNALKPFFKVEAVAYDSLDEKMNKAGREDIVFGFFLGKESFLLTLNQASAWKKKMLAGKPNVWYCLDVNILGHLIFASLWNLPEKNWESVIGFTQSAEEMRGLVENAKAAAAFVLRAPRVEVLRTMGEAHELMPQKSTYFHPKLASGILFYHHGH